MTVQELLDMLKGATPTDNVYIRVDCPNGGNSLPIEVNNVNAIDGLGAWLVMRPLDGYEFDVEDMLEDDDDDDDDYEPDFGQCGKCGQWVHFPCYTCQARAMEAKAPRRMAEATEEEALMQHIDHVAENRGDR
jgi:hypothetical protein